MAPLPTSSALADTPTPAPAAPPSALRRAWEGWPGRVLRVLLAALPLYWLFRRLDWREVIHEAGAVGPAGIGLAFACVFASVAVGAVRWGVMLRAYGATNLPPLSTMLRHNLVGLWFNMLPSGVAGDAVRGHRVRQVAGSLATSYTVLFVERVSGLLGLCLIAGASMLSPVSIRSDAVSWTLGLGLLGAAGLSAVLLLVPFAIARQPSLRALVERAPVLGPMLVKVPPPRTLRGPLLSVLLSVLTQGALVVCVYFLLRPLSSVATFGLCARVVPAIILVTYIPLTPGGLGQREAAFRALFGLAGVPGTMAVAASLLFFAEIVGVSVLGGLCIAAERLAAARGRPWDGA
jgi:uncharacterized membrane protein YbhN (UPF0104 family)